MSAKRLEIGARGIIISARRLSLEPVVFQEEQFASEISRLIDLEDSEIWDQDSDDFGFQPDQTALLPSPGCTDTSNSVLPGSNLCLTCQRIIEIDIRRPREDLWSTHELSYHSLDQLHFCKFHGCLICGLFLFVLKARYKNSLLGLEQLTWSFSNPTLRFHLINPDAEVSIHFNAPSISPSLSTKTILNPVKWSFDLAKNAGRQWLKSCLRSHKRCRTSKQDKSWNPARLIDLQNQPTVRLRRGSQLPPGVAYATLSHRWGDIVPYKLTSETETELYQGKNLESFSIVFQQAMRYAHALGLQYLWIDSLCIIQDDEGDWNFQSSQMAKIYGNTIVNISAGGSIDGNQSFIPDGLSGFEMVTKESNHIYQMSYFSNEDQMFNEQPLHSRGWVVQEHFLSRRVIYFTPWQIYWRCKDCTTCMHHGHQQNNYIGYGSMNYGNDDESLEEQWRNICQNYMRTNLTYPTDRLVAFSGIAQHFGIRFKEQGKITQYAAGIWFHDPFQLLWRPRQPVFKRQDDEYTAPSWSWASLDPFQLEFSYKFFNPAFSITSTSLNTTASGDIFGKLLPGSNITIACTKYKHILFRNIESTTHGRTFDWAAQMGMTTIWMNHYPDTTDSIMPLPVEHAIFTLGYFSQENLVSGLVLLPKSQSNQHGSTTDPDSLIRWGVWEGLCENSSQGLRTGFWDAFGYDINHPEESEWHDLTIY